jgi:hypothetical protein
MLEGYLGDIFFSEITTENQYFLIIPNQLDNIYTFWQDLCKQTHYYKRKLN